MTKITKGSYRYEQSGGIYEVLYNSDSTFFYTHIGKLFPGAVEFFKAINGNDNNDLEGLADTWMKRIGNVKIIFGATEKELENRVNAFHKKYVTTAIEETKVVLYRLDYVTRDQCSDKGMGFSSHGRTGELRLEFQYYIAIKKKFDTKTIYKDPVSEYIHQSHSVSGFKEVAWTRTRGLYKFI